MELDLELDLEDPKDIRFRARSKRSKEIIHGVFKMSFLFFFKNSGN